MNTYTLAGRLLYTHWPEDYCRELTCWPDLKRKPLVSERKSLTTKLRALQKMVEWLIGML